MSAPSPFGAAAAPAPPTPAAAYAPPAPAAAPPAPAAAPPAPAPAAVAPPAAPAAAPAAPAPATPFQAAAAPATAAAPASASPDLAFGAGGDPFSAPRGISGEKITQFEGELICVRPTEVIAEMKTSRGIAKGVIRGNCAVLSGARAGEIIADMLVFQTALQRDLTAVLAKGNPAQPAILGRLGKSRDKNDGNDPAWIFVPASEQDTAYASHWAKQNPAFFA